MTHEASATRLDVGGTILALRRRGCGWDQLAAAFDVTEREAEVMAAKFIQATQEGAGRDRKAPAPIGYRKPPRVPGGLR